MLNLTEYASKPRLLADYLPWACLVAPGVVLNKDGSFQTGFRYRGPDLESSTPDELVAVSAKVNNVLRRFGSGWVLFFEAVRRAASDYSEDRFSNAAAWLVDQERSAAARGDADRFESDYYLTLLWLPPEDTLGRAEQALIERPARPQGAGWHQALEQFETQAGQVFDLLSGTLAEIAPLSDDETLTYLHACVSTRRHPVTVPELPVFLDAVLADAPFTGGLEPMLGDAYLKTLTVLGFPGSTLPGLLDELNRQGFAYRWVTRFIALDKTEATRLLTRKRRHWFAKRKSVGAVLRETLFQEESLLLDSDATNKATDADAALQELGSDLVAYGYVTTTLTVCDPDLSRAQAQLRAAEHVLNARGFTLIRETLNAAEAWLGSLPGHAYANVRRPVISTLNLAHMVPLSAVWAGEAWNNHLGGAALIEARTDGTTPFRLNLHVADVGHTLVVGPTGSGKSVLLCLLALQWTRYAGAQVFVFDKGRSARAAILAMDGLHVSLGAAGVPALQPLRDIDTPQGATFAADWLAGLCAGEGLSPDPDLKAALWDAVQALATAPARERTLTGLCLLLQSPRLKSALMPFTLEGPYGRLLDGDTDALELSSLACFEMEALMQSPAAAAPVLTYIFHRLEARFDGRPTLLLLDEAWLYLDHPVFAPRLRDWLKTLRKKNVAVVFATQTLADIERAAIAPAVIDACPVRIFLANERAGEPVQASTYRRFGLNDRQITLISQALAKRDYYYTSPLGCRLFELGLGAVGLSFCAAGSPEMQARVDDAVTRADARGFADAFLRSLDLGWAADLLSDWQPAAAPSPQASPAEKEQAHEIP
ncbi:MAG: conjugal transfer protein TrbE [Hyphomonas sp.]|uniref:conjugal transfer protein TrbE n=1 Tax=Hyphomonas sp. TaxID=87 RepID=UPI0017AF3EEA|nr:conjugal transfer protein TrbE [Hyphomonas sp.]MBA3069125.1 conjugal transfer protein TrbE [Hyphomonas sp.]MBU3919338.1 conjugal transfer protein TrbE [Alphaproteobacteria bacterium]MBU4061540.1 conjugal transfer protein TrbE [Alphaproteobacteria bacterium]MBU4165398.1 conjugal transfer protein TrbE [Alphaproteobacteria bacterium]